MIQIPRLLLFLSASLSASAGNHLLWRTAGETKPGLIGTIYDFNLKPDGKPRYRPGEVMELGPQFWKDTTPFVRSGWEEKSVTAKSYVKGKVSVGHIFVPVMSSIAFPELVEGYIVPKARWVAVFRGRVIAPKTAKFRFWGLCDDAMTVRFNGKLVLDSGYCLFTEPNSFASGWDHLKPVLGVKDKKTTGRHKIYGVPFRAGPWINVNQGSEAPIEIILADAGLNFCSYLMIEEYTPGTRPEPKLMAFRVNDTPIEVTDDTSLNVDLKATGWIWGCK